MPPPAALPEPEPRGANEVRLNSPQPSPALVSGLDRAGPVLRGGLTLFAGVLTGNVIGFGRVALTAYLLGTQSRADSLAVAMGPVDTLNSVLMNSIVFGFVPMLTATAGAHRAALFRKLTRTFLWVSVVIAVAVMLAAEWLMRALAPGLDPRYFGTAVNVLRILGFSTLAAGPAAVQCAMLYTGRRFAPTAFYQASLNAFTILFALALFRHIGVYAFAMGYTAGAWVQLGIVYFAARAGREPADVSPVEITWREILAKPAFFAVYAAGLGLNITFTRAYATHSGPGMAAALDYCMRGVGVPLALLVNPISNSLLPEIARLRSTFRLREAIRLIERTIALAALAAIAACGFALLFREPAITLFFQRGSFTPESTKLVSAVFLGFAPSLVGWSLFEVTSRAMFSLDRRWPPVIASAIPLVLNIFITLRWHDARPEQIGLGASIGLMAGFLALFCFLFRKRAQ